MRNLSFNLNSTLKSKFVKQVGISTLDILLGIKANHLNQFQSKPLKNHLESTLSSILYKSDRDLDWRQHEDIFQNFFLYKFYVHQFREIRKNEDLPISMNYSHQDILNHCNLVLLFRFQSLWESSPQRLRPQRKPHM